MVPSGWDPFRELAGLQDRLDRMFRDIDRTRYEEHFMASHWTPPVDIYEAEDSFILKLEVPEVSKDSIDISVEENELTITGERSLEPGTNGDQYLRMERGYGMFTRSFSLAKAIEVAKIKALVKDGILRVELPKKGEVPPKQIIIEGE